ncbi:MFS transporter [Aureibacter tunicatorum]|uniref:ACS family hexuronate transporter-like MFS transporter n=1 Tax=Aureibacter tunicatorum TaxID=866807 RepID=A0AAE3XQ28_9BACT|nr:MFS transporter [Aureibacter tunicatorum]MDR6239269.1 ACS family hexuronate transporter-like MFS transporter [Aureibacter tunicatorum]BDD04806.1 hexuronate transporter [Aureibacter tunicatorum]
MNTKSTLEQETKNKKIGKYRYRILALLLVATTINYMDRSIMGVLAPTLFKVFDWSTMDYAYINISFKIAYGLGLLTMGSLIDKMGTKKGYTISISLWSISGMMHAVIKPAMGWVGFAFARFGLGFGEAGNFPSAIKTVAEWFPKKDRAFATGIFNAGANVGAMLAPLIVAFVVQDNGDGWQIPFLVTGTFSMIWIVVWNRVYRKPEDHPEVSPEELAYIQSDEAANPENKEQKSSWFKLFKTKEIWAIIAGKSFTDPVWYFFLFWGGKFLNDQYEADTKALALPLITIYVIADLGSVFGGWLPKFFIEKMNMDINKGRKLTMLLCGLVVLPVAMVPFIDSMWTSIMLISLTAAAHQAWSCNIMTVASDVFPKRFVASVSGIGGCAGIIAGALADYGLGNILTDEKIASGSAYEIPFILMSFGYLIAFGMVQLLAPKLKMAKC